MKKNKILLLIIICLVFHSCFEFKNNKIVFQTEDKKIKVYQWEMEYEFERSVEESGVIIGEISESEVKKLKKQIIEKIALRKAIVLEGKKQKIHKSQKYKDGLKGNKETYTALLTIDERSKNVVVTEREMREYYENNKDKYIRKEDTVRLQIIVLNSKDMKLAEKVLKESVEKAREFTQLVKKYSISSDEFEGQTGEIPKSVLEKEYPEISREIQNVSEDNVVNKVIVAGNEVYIVKVLEKLPRGFVSFDKVKKGIYQELLIKGRNLKNEYFIDEVKSKYKLNKINENDLEF